MINSRPLYPSSEDVWEEPPITPNDILIGRHSCPPQPEQEARVNPRHLLISVQNRVAEFWTLVEVLCFIVAAAEQVVS